MIRQVDMKEISDGKTYRASDCVRLGTGGCSGCSSCCRGMGESVKLDPMDIWRLQIEQGLFFEDLLGSKIELNVVDGLVIPNLVMAGPREACGFLNGEGRCSIHPSRPGFCRLFPLGRLYEGEDFVYFLQIHECDRMTTKVRIRKWLEIPRIGDYEDYIRQWHNLTTQVRRLLEEISSAPLRGKICTRMLEIFFVCPWEEEEDFYTQFGQRLAQARRQMGMA